MAISTVRVPPTFLQSFPIILGTVFPFLLVQLCHIEKRGIDQAAGSAAISGHVFDSVRGLWEGRGGYGMWVWGRGCHVGEGVESDER